MLKTIAQITLFILLSLVTLVAFGQDSEPVPGQSIADMLFKLISSAEGQAVAIGIAIEFVLRMVKSKKPLGVLHSIVGVLKLLVKVLDALVKFLDKVLPQKTSAPLSLVK